MVFHRSEKCWPALLHASFTLLQASEKNPEIVLPIDSNVSFVVIAFHMAANASAAVFQISEILSHASRKGCFREFRTSARDASPRIRFQIPVKKPVTVSQMSFISSHAVLNGVRSTSLIALRSGFSSIAVQIS